MAESEKNPKTPAKKAPASKESSQAKPAATTPAPAVVAAPQTNTLAIVSLVAGVAGLTVLPFLASIVAVVTGHIGRKELRAKGQSGDGLAIAGLITGYIGIGLGLLVAIILFIFFGVLVAAGGMYYR
jgi:hypothetical protein